MMMTSRYRVEYHLTSHRGDKLTEWIMGLLVVPFVLVREHLSITAEDESRQVAIRERYAKVFADVEGLIAGHRTAPP
jgi:IMP and pyridine-specific 5'-nucleotidase